MTRKKYDRQFKLAAVKLVNDDHIAAVQIDILRYG